jgi:hypothetical protein
LEELPDHIPSGGTAADLEREIGAVRDREAARRRHLIALLKLDRARIPGRLRQAVRDFVRDADRPTRWPEAEGAERAEFFVEYLNEVSEDWWAAWATIDAEDPTHLKIQSVADLLADRLPTEIEAVAQAHDEEAPALTTLMSTRSGRIHDYVRLLEERGLIPAGLPSGRATGTAPHEISPPRSTWAAAQRRVESMLRTHAASMGDGQTVEQAFVAFGRTDFAGALRAGASAWAWCRKTGADAEAGPLLAIAAWAAAHGSTEKQRYPGADLDAAGLLLRHHKRIRERLRGSNELDVPRIVFTALGESTSPTPDAAALAHLLIRLSEEPAGSEQRDRFAVLLRTADAPDSGQLLWDGLQGLRETARPRKALLVLLHDLGEHAALARLFEQTGAHRKYLSAFVALVERARREPSAKLGAAVLQSHHMVESLAIPRPMLDFANTIVQRLRLLGEDAVRLQIAETLEGDGPKGPYGLCVVIQPNDTDPPLSLTVEVVSTGDFVAAEGERPLAEVAREELLFEPREIEFKVKPNASAPSTVTLRVRGETASGRTIDLEQRFPTTIAEGGKFEQISADELMDIYQGCDGRPVVPPAFVGRDEELTVLQRAVGGNDPGAAILYGIRRLGKTSLLGELRRRSCIAFESHYSRTCFITVPVDEFTYDAGKPFLDRFLRHIWLSILHDPKNQKLRQYLNHVGVTRQQLEEAGHLSDSFADASFLTRLREILSRVRRLTRERIERTVLVFDEFDKLLEHYRSDNREHVEDLTSQLRRAATEESTIGIVVAGSDLMREVVGHYRNALYGSATEIELKTFDRRADAVAVRRIVAPESLRGRRIFEADVVNHILELTGGHPLFIRLVACAAATVSRRRVVSRGTVREAVSALLRNDVLEGRISNFSNMVRQPLQVLRLLSPEDAVLAELLLVEFASITTMERPGVTWVEVRSVDRLRALRSEEVWTRIRDELVTAGLVLVNERRQWSIRYPVLAEQLRTHAEIELDRLEGAVRSMQAA